MMRDDWKRCIVEARKRSEQAWKEWRLNAPSRVVVPGSADEIATESDLSDYALQPGNIVSTGKGFVAVSRLVRGGRAPVAPRKTHPSAQADTGLLIAAIEDGLPPTPVLAVPADRLGQAALKILLGAPAEFPLDL